MGLGNSRCLLVLFLLVCVALPFAKRQVHQVPYPDIKPDYTIAKGGLLGRSRGDVVPSAGAREV